MGHWKTDVDIDINIDNINTLCSHLILKNLILGSKYILVWLEQCDTNDSNILDHTSHFISCVHTAQRPSRDYITQKLFNTSSLSQIRSYLIPFTNAHRGLEKHTDSAVHCMGQKASAYNRFLDVLCLQSLPTGFLTLHSNQSIKTQAELHLKRKIPQTGYYLTPQQGVVNIKKHCFFQHIIMGEYITSIFDKRFGLIQ